jgi:glycosyltransferase involved in cell wall biosynthesis
VLRSTALSFLSRLEQFCKIAFDINRNMKITFITPGWGNAGGDRVVAIYAERLQRRGHEVILVAPAKRRTSLLIRIKRALRGEHPVEPEEPTFLADSVPRKRGQRIGSVRSDDVPDADVVIATWWETAEWVNDLPPEKGAKAHFIQHYEAFEYVPKDRVDAVWRLPLQKITISKWLVDLAATRFGDTDVVLIPNSVETSQFNAPARGKNAVPVIGMLYSDVPWKGTDVCLAAIGKLPYPVRIIAFSSGVKVPGAQGTPALPANADFHYRPAQDLIPKLYARCDVWLCGSRGEGFHLPPLEAMACRCPVVSTAVGGPVDIIEDGINGYVVPCEDSDGLADRLQRVLGLPDATWRQMSDAALQTALRYTWDEATSLFESALEKAIQRTAANTRPELPTGQLARRLA